MLLKSQCFIMICRALDLTEPSLGLDYVVVLAKAGAAAALHE